MENESTSANTEETASEQPAQVEPIEDASQDGGSPVEEDILALFQQIKKLTDERDQFQDQVLRTMADFQNFRNRKLQQEAQLKIYATENLVRDLLPVLDNFGRTLLAADSGAPVEAIIEGIRATARQLFGVLETQQVMRIEPLGEPFDPEFHEALGVEITDEVAEGAVAVVLEPGYKMANRLIRPARVKVAGKG